MTRRALAVLLALAGVLLLPASALAADHTVTLATSGPSPSTLTIALGDTVTFKTNDANTTYHVRRSSGSWTFTATVTRAKPVTTKAFSASGNYGYSMTFDTLIGESPPQDGLIVVPAPSPTPSATAKPTTKPTTKPSSQPTTASPRPSVVPTSSGVAVPPPITGAVIPTPVVTPSLGPAPQVATPGTTGSPSASPVPHVAYGNPSGIVQKSPHGMGLPTVLALVAAAGVATLIVRILLAAPEAQPEARAGVR